MIKLRGVNKISTLSWIVRIVTGILSVPKAFLLFNWDISLCASSSLVGFSRNKFNELFLRTLLNGLRESGMVFDRLGSMSIKKLLKTLAISVGFVISLPFTLTMSGWTLLLDFRVISCPIPFHLKVVLLRFFSKHNLKYSFLDLRIEKVTLFLNFLSSSRINFFWVSFLQAQYFRNNLSLFHGFVCKVLSFLMTLVNSAWQS